MKCCCIPSQKKRNKQTNLTMKEHRSDLRFMALEKRSLGIDVKLFELSPKVEVEFVNTKEI